MNFKTIEFGVLGVVLILAVIGCGTSSPDITDPPQKQAEAIKSQGGAYKVGNPYKVLGRWYYPKEDYSYSEVGTASWYGPDFHAKRTANNEKYDMHSLTAAHRTLPLPSIVRVTNLDNGRSLVVRVNDRGPYARERIIDISKKGAQLLGFLENGTAKVRVEVLEKESKNLKAALTDGLASKNYIAAAPAPKISKSNILPIGETATVIELEEKISERDDTILVEEVVEMKSADVDKGFFVQAGAFSNPDSAKDLSSKLKNFGNVQITQANVNGSMFYRVRVGPFSRQQEAIVTQARIRNSGIPSTHVVEN